MRKIGLFTPIDVYNYGTKLQAYAMQSIFRKRGYDTEIVILSEKRGLISKTKYLLSRIFYKAYINRKRNIYLKKYYPSLNNSILIKSLKERLSSLDDFDKFYKIRIFTSKSNLKHISTHYSAAVCGSDQIWHPIINRSEFWTLQLINESVPHIAYAPSLGIDTMPEDAVPFFQNFLKSFSAISIREVSGAQILEKLTNKPVQVVLDPTLLVGREIWDTLLDEKMELPQEQYCLCYLLGTSAEHREIIKKVAKELNIVIYNFSHFKEYNEADEQLEGKHLYGISPREFVTLISKARFVLTDSFHCTVFSAMYHVPFLTLLRYAISDGNSTNNRIYSVLSQFNLENRILTDSAKLEEKLKSKIDFNYFEHILAQKRKESNSFLDNAINKY